MSKAVLVVITFCLASFAAQAQVPSPTPALPKKIGLLPSKTENTQDFQPSIANKRAVISMFKAIQTKQTDLIGDIDEKLKSKLKETQGVKVTDDATASEIRINKLQESMETFGKRRQEALERSQFIDRLIFAIDTKWTKDSLKTFLEQTLLDIASAEMNQSDSKSPSNLWKFATYLSMAVRELPEPREDLVSFVDNYMDYSSVLDPKPPTAFAQARSYTNGVKSESAKVTKQEDLGDGVEKKVKEADRAHKSDETAPSVIQGTTSAPIEPPQPSTQPPNAPNPEPTAAQNSK